MGGGENKRGGEEGSFGKKWMEAKKIMKLIAGEDGEGARMKLNTRMLVARVWGGCVKAMRRYNET